jgi:hypothetical protein
MKKDETSKIEVTLQDVLEVTQQGFEYIDNELREVKAKMATKDDIARLEEEMATKDDILRIENRFERRIEILEDDVRVLKTTVGKK